VDRLDLYHEGCEPCLTAAGRRRYDTPLAEVTAVEDDVARRLAAEKLVLVFPQWWFNMPAVLKGWFDRVFQPSVAFDHTPGHSRILPRLERLQAWSGFSPC